MPLSRALANLWLLVAIASGHAFGAGYMAVGGGRFASVLPADEKAADMAVAPFALRVAPVSNAEFLAFVIAHPAWQRDQVARIFADGQYLAHWPRADAIGDDQRDQPVTHVSWFAAQAFCESEGARLPSWLEWELSAAADATRKDARADPAWREQILSWYSRPSRTQLDAVGSGPANVYGIRNLHGLVWEWVDDFNALLVAADSRDQNDPDRLKFCGAGALSLRDLDNYAVLMRIAMLSSLKASDTTANVGFRCARIGVGKS